MNLETVFYIIGIISMSLWILIFVIGLLFIIRLRQGAQAMRTGMQDKVRSFFKGKQHEIIGAIGLTIATFVINKIKESKEKEG